MGFVCASRAHTDFHAVKLFIESKIKQIDVIICKSCKKSGFTLK